jgi:hypothetical protein
MIVMIQEMFASMSPATMLQKMGDGVGQSAIVGVFTRAKQQREREINEKSK